VTRPRAHLAFPFAIGADGRTQTVASTAEHVEDEILQLVLTDLGERLFLPELGTNVRRLVFENDSERTQGVTRSLITQAINRWLGRRVTLEELIVEGAGETMEVVLRYRLAGTEDSRILRFQRSAA